MRCCDCSSLRLWLVHAACCRCWCTQVVSLADELAADRPFAAFVTLVLSKLKNLTCLLLLNTSLTLSAAGLASLSQCRHMRQLLLAPPAPAKGPLAAANTLVRCYCAGSAAVALGEGMEGWWYSAAHASPMPSLYTLFVVAH